jgi:hypothetical protein
MLRLSLIVLTACACFARTETLRKEHPRLIALDSDIARIRELVRHDAGARGIYEALLQKARKIESEPPVVHRLIGPRLLDQSRRALDRIYTLALLHRIDGERRYLDRALKELRAAADFPDWNPSHFLDTAEMTHAFAIGYDWLYPALSQEERRWIRQAIVDKGINQALPLYSAQRGWVVNRYNWNQVCNGGIGIGALAIAGDEPELANKVINYAVESIPRAMRSYSPDGGWAEGPGYWHYATRYTVYFLAALETALGKDFDLSKIEGFDRAAHFRVYYAGPLDRSFNYADASDGVGAAEEMFWLARRFRQPVYAWHEQQQLARGHNPVALHLVWYQPELQSPRDAEWPLDARFDSVQVAFLRSAWDDPDAIFVGVKGGDNKAGHAQLDLGTFVLDALGVRWARDLGTDNYNLPGYFGKQRWTYYRMRTESHNTVLIDGENQDPKAEAKILETSFATGLAWANIDLAAAYPGRVKEFTRRVSLVNRREVVTEDRITAAAPVEALWGMVTDAEIELQGERAVLRKNGKTLRAEIRSPATARFEVVSTGRAAPENPNTGTRKLVVRLPEKIQQVRLEVALIPSL